MILLIVLSLLRLDVLSAQKSAILAESFAYATASVESHTSTAPFAAAIPSSAISTSPVTTTAPFAAAIPSSAISTSPVTTTTPFAAAIPSSAISTSPVTTTCTTSAETATFVSTENSPIAEISTSTETTSSIAATTTSTTSTSTAPSAEKMEEQIFPATVKSRFTVGGPANDAAEEQEEDQYEGIPASEIEKVVSEELQMAKKTHIFIDDIAGSFLFVYPEKEYFTEVMSVSITHPTGEKRMSIPLKILDELSDEEQEQVIKFYEKEKSNERLFKGKVKMKLLNGDYIALNGEVKRNFGKEKRKLDVIIHPVLAALGNSTITVSNKQFHLNGTLGTISYRQLKDLIAKHPDIKMLVLHKSDGSVNDAVNMHTGRLVRKNKITTMVLKDSQIHSGAVDLFASGEKRIFNRGAELGVHSWCCIEDKTAVQLPDDHPGHKAQLQYFTEMLGDADGPAFYFFTIKAAAFDDVKIMTEREIKKYNLATEIK